MRYRHINYVVSVLALLTTPQLLGQQPQFEAVLSGQLVLGCNILPFIFPTLYWFNPDVHFSDDREHAIDDLASAPGQPVYAVSDEEIFTIHPDGTRMPFFSSVPVDAITVASTGRVFARTVGDLAVISAGGTLEATHALPGSTGMIAVASDSCTIYYQKTTGIGRINGCTGVPLPDFLPTVFVDLYPLPSGDVLIAREANVVLHDNSGAVIRSVATKAAFGFDDSHTFQQVAASPDGQILYVAIMNFCDDAGSSDSVLLTTSMQSGNELSRREVEFMNTANALVVGAASAPLIPTASETSLLILALILAFGGTLVLRR